MPDGDRGVFIQGIDIGMILGGLVSLIGTFESHESLEGLDRRRGDGMHFPVAPPAVKTGIGQALSARSGQSFGMAPDGFMGKFL